MRRRAAERNHRTSPFLKLLLSGGLWGPPAGYRFNGGCGEQRAMAKQEHLRTQILQLRPWPAGEMWTRRRQFS